MREPALSARMQGWNRIMTTIALDPVSKARVMYDILNEPDCRGIGWEGGGSGRSMVRSLLHVFIMPRHTPCTAAPLANTV